MKNIAELVDNDIEFKNNLMAYNLYSLVFYKGKGQNTQLTIDETRLDTMTRCELPNKNVEALMILYILHKKKEDKEYLQIVSEKFQIPKIDIFYFNALLGRISILELLMEKEPTILKLPHTETLPSAYPIGLLQKEVLEWLQHKDPQFLEYLLYKSYCGYFERACEYGQIDALEWIELNLPALLATMLSKNINEAFAEACSNARLPILHWIEKQVTKEALQELIEQRNYRVFTDACRWGNVELVRWLKPKIPSDALNKLIRPSNYAIYVMVAEKKLFEITKLLLWDLGCFLYADKCRELSFGEALNQFIDEELEKLRTGPNAVSLIIDPATIKLYFYMARNIVRGEQQKHEGKLQLLLSIPALKALAHEEVTAKIPNELMQVALLCGNFNAADELLKIEAVATATVDNAFYYTSIPAGDLCHNFLCWLKRTNPEILNAILSKDIQTIFNEAYIARHVKTLELLKSIKPEIFHKLIVAASKVTAQNDLIIGAYHGDIPFLNWLKNTLTKKEFNNAITAVGAQAFKNACLAERIDVLDWFKKVVSPAVLLSMIRYENYDSFRSASERNTIKTLQWIKQAVDSDLFNCMIKYNSFEAFRVAGGKSLYWLLWNPACFAYVEQSQNDKELLHSHALAVVKELESERNQFIASNAKQVFDLQESEKVTLCFYILRYLISCKWGEYKVADTFTFLLAIPAVNALRKPRDELMELATNKKNTGVLDLLSRTPLKKNVKPNTNSFYKPNSDNLQPILGKRRNNKIGNSYG